MRSIAVVTTLALATLLALPARANWDVKANQNCFESNDDETRIQRERDRNEFLIARCLGVAESHPSVADHSLVFDSDTGQLNVIRDCDALVVCNLASSIGCATGVRGDESDYKLKEQCLLANDDPLFYGALMCKVNESCRNCGEGAERFRFRISCKGSYTGMGIPGPCDLSFKSRRLHELRGACPNN
jgi:hypothetical protein